MSSLQSSGRSSPLSSTVTLSTPPSPRLKQVLDSPQESLFHNTHVQGSAIVEHIASNKSNSSQVYVFDVAEQVGFGTLTKAWAKLGESATVLDLQARSGAGLSLIGRLSQGPSVDAGKKAILTAYTTPPGLALMSPSLTYLPPPSAESRLIVQVPTVVSAGETLGLSPSLASLAAAWPLLPDSLVVLLSSTTQQAADFADLAYRLPNSHVIHLFDHYTSGREFGHATVPPREVIPSDNVAKVVESAGYHFFDYSGDSNAHTVLVLLNGPLALAAKAIVKSSLSSGLGVVVVNVLRPWDEAALRRAIPSSAKTLHVFDDVPNTLTQGALYSDVFSTLWTPAGALAIHARRITPSHTHQLLNETDAFTQFIGEIVPSFSTAFVDIQIKAAKRLLLLSNPQSPLSSFSHVVENLFTTKTIRSRLLIDHDVFSKQGGITASRLLLAPESDINSPLPLSLEIPLEPLADGSTDFLGVLDQSLLKTHHIFDLARDNSVALVVTTWTAEEFVANVPPAVIALILRKNIAIFILNSKQIATNLAGAPGPVHDTLQTVVTYLGFLRLYLGSAASEPVVEKLAQDAFQEAFHGIPISKISSHTWPALQEVDIVPPAELTSSNLKTIEANAIVVETLDGDTLVNGSKLGSWHDAAKHLIFPSVYAPDETALTEEEHPQDPSLRPEIPERTFLATCTVNRRLTPLEYNRNVFHLEFDTSGTGLKYDIGEALGVYGWNDEQEVLDFCAFYNVDPNKLVTIPIPGSDKLHTRTILQALQQQVDLLGKPPKSFYTDLAAYASSSIDKHALLFIGSPEGSSMFKKLSEKDTVTFADVLKMYPSAKPGIEKLCELVGDIKARHYSIASSQAVVGDRVDLLIVTVDWTTPNGMLYPIPSGTSADV